MTLFVPLKKLGLFYGVIALISFLWIKTASLPVQFFGLKGLLPALFISILVFLISTSVSNTYGWAKKLEQLFIDALSPLSLETIIIIAITSSIGEEFLFRGVIQAYLGLTFTSLLFGIVHFPINERLLPWTIMATLMGFVLGGLYAYSGHLLAPILLHFLINLLNLWMLWQKNITS